MSLLFDALEPQSDFEELAKIEPRLAALLAEAKALRKTRGLDITRAWYANADESGLRDRFQNLVGWSRRDGDPRLGTSESYDIVYDSLFEILSGRKLI